MLRVFVATATMTVGIVLLSCDARQPMADQSSPNMPMGTAPLAPIARSTLPPPVGYASPPPLANSPTPLVPYASSSNGGVESQTALGGWRTSPQWGAVKGEGCIVVEQDRQSQFADQSETAKVRVENCPNEDIGDLSLAPPQEP